jgi:hypothetical protein
MPNRKHDDELYGAALGRTSDCPPLEELELLLDEAVPSPLKQHVNGCSHCQTELQMLRSFTAGDVAAHEQPAVDSIVARLQSRSAEITAPRHYVPECQSWWRQLLATRWLTPVAATAAVALVVAGVAVELRQGRQPLLDTATHGTEVLRSASISILSPSGDLQEAPSEIRWEAAPNAVRYRIRLMEVDRAELWSAETPTPRIDLPPGARSLIVPAKTLLIQVVAFDAAGAKIAESEAVRFRFLQNIYRR